MPLTSNLQDTVALPPKETHSGAVPQYKSDWSAPDWKSPAVLPFHTSKRKPVGNDAEPLPVTIRTVGEATHLHKLRPVEPLVEHERHLRQKPEHHLAAPTRAGASVEDLLKELVSKLH